MKPLYTQNDFEKAKGFDKLPIQCYTCGKTSYKQKKIINEFIKYNKGTLKFCSKKCNTSTTTKEKVCCKNCSIEFFKNPSQIKRTKNNFCSQSCATIYQNKNKISGFNKSKIEFWLENKLKEVYPNIEFQFNERKTLGLELDIFIPKFNLAFEINGIFHYKPIFGKDRLQRYQQSDIKKQQLCKDKKINLYTIDISEMKYFTPKKAQFFLDKISSIINLSNQ